MKTTKQISTPMNEVMNENLENCYDWSNVEFTDPATGKKGLKSIKGELVIPAQYDSFPNLGSLFLDPWEYIVAVKNGKYGILSGSHAEVVVPFEYDDIVHVNMKGYVCRKGSQEKIVCPNGYGNDGPNSCLEIPEMFLP